MQPETALRELLLTLLKIPSVIENEQEIAGHVERWGHHLGLEVDRLGNAVVVEPKATRGLPRIGLFGHLDTVPGPADLGRPRSEGDRIIGLGASDMKAGLAVQQLLLTDTEGYARHPVCVFYDKEEGDYADNGLGPLLEARPDLAELDFAVVLEPTDNQIHVGAVGTLHAEARFSGVRAHSARPWLGDNAIHKAWPLLQKLAASKPREVVLAGLCFRELWSATFAQGGSARNVVPDSFVININYRFAPGKSLDQAQEDVRGLVGTLAEVVFTDLAPSGKICTEHPEYQRLRAVSGAEVCPKQAWTDVARLGELGLAAVNFGPGRTDQAHKVGEWVSLAETVQSFECLQRFLCGQEA